MKWPWVSRESYDFAVAAVNDVRRMNDVERNRFDRLLEKFTALRLQGATAPDPVTPRVQKEIDPLTQAVLDASRGKPQSIRNAMLKQLNEDKKAVELGTMEVADVLRRIEIGFTPDDGIPE